MDIASSIAQTIVLFKHNGQICFEPASGEWAIGERAAQMAVNATRRAPWWEFHSPQWMRQEPTPEVFAPAKGPLAPRRP
jgi:hypothetical protein